MVFATLCQHKFLQLYLFCYPPIFYRIAQMPCAQPTHQSTRSYGTATFFDAANHAVLRIVDAGNVCGLQVKNVQKTFRHDRCLTTIALDCV
jgi:hypothetical protein